MILSHLLCVYMILSYAGVSCVLSTICDVDDRGAKRLIENFYSSLLGSPEAPLDQPLDSVDALQSAVLQRLGEVRKDLTTQPGQLLRAGPSVGQNTGPHDWASYVITGLPVDSFGPKPFGP